MHPQLGRVGSINSRPNGRKGQHDSETTRIAGIAGIAGDPGEAVKRQGRAAAAIAIARHHQLCRQTWSSGHLKRLPKTTKNYKRGEGGKHCNKKQLLGHASKPAMPPGICLNKLCFYLDRFWYLVTLFRILFECYLLYICYIF